MRTYRGDSTIYGTCLVFKRHNFDAFWSRLHRPFLVHKSQPLRGQFVLTCPEQHRSIVVRTHCLQPCIAEGWAPVRRRTPIDAVCIKWRTIQLLLLLAYPINRMRTKPFAPGIEVDFDSDGYLHSTVGIRGKYYRRQAVIGSPHSYLGLARTELVELVRGGPHELVARSSVPGGSRYRRVACNISVSSMMFPISTFIQLVYSCKCRSTWCHSSGFIYCVFETSITGPAV